MFNATYLNALAVLGMVMGGLIAFFAMWYTTEQRAALALWVHEGERTWWRFSIAMIYPLSILAVIYATGHWLGTPTAAGLLIGFFAGGVQTQDDFEHELERLQEKANSV